MRASRQGDSERRQRCQDPDATSRARAALAARSSAAADISAAPPSSNSRALTSGCSHARPPHDLAGLSDHALHHLWEGLLDLPATDLSLHVTLPKLIGPDLQRLRESIADDDPDWGRDALTAVAAQIDTPRQRAQLADALVQLRDQQRINRRQAAAAILDLDSQSTRFIAASLLEAVALSIGASHTPGGLQIAA
jgi:hypothetical protein